MSNVTPSKIARAAASANWGPVQSQKTILPGVVGFDTAGHGGVVAVIGHCDIDDRLVQIARDLGFVEHVLVVAGSRRTQMFSSARYDLDWMLNYANTHTDGTLYEVWIGEEDCGWATIAYAQPKTIENAKYFSEHLTADDVRTSLVRWNDEFLARAEGRPEFVSYEFLPKEQRTLPSGFAVYRIYRTADRVQVAEYATEDEARMHVALADNLT